MNSNLRRLFAIAARPTRTIIGLMSGTSLDGLDIALCRISDSGPDVAVELVRFATIAYPDSVKEEIRKVFARPVVELERLTLLNAWLGDLHAGYILDCLRQWGIGTDSVDLIASHGQTVFHSPKSLHCLSDFPNATLQIGDGDHIAVRTGILTISDLRQKHVAAGGEGAPLALYGDYFLFSRRGEDRVMLNLGGIANFTYLPGDLDADRVLVTDTGPGNTLIDAYTQVSFGVAFDRDALLARQGKVSETLLAALKASEFFNDNIPKTTGPERFNPEYLRMAIENSGSQLLSSYDVLATLTRLSAVTVADALKRALPGLASATIYCSGGGAHNPLLMQDLQQELNGVAMRPTDELGIPGDAKEAVLFALLANETIAGEPVVFKQGGCGAISLGKLSFPG